MSVNRYLAIENSAKDLSSEYSDHEIFKSFIEDARQLRHLHHDTSLAPLLRTCSLTLLVARSSFPSSATRSHAPALHGNIAFTSVMVASECIGSGS